MSQLFLDKKDIIGLDDAEVEHIQSIYHSASRLMAYPDLQQAIDEAAENVDLASLRRTLSAQTLSFEPTEDDS